MNWYVHEQSYEGMSSHSEIIKLQAFSVRCLCADPLNKFVDLTLHADLIAFKKDWSKIVFIFVYLHILLLHGSSRPEMGIGQPFSLCAPKSAKIIGQIFPLAHR